MIQKEQEFLTVADVAQLMRISRSSAFNLFHRLGFPSLRVGKLLRVRVEDFDDWCAQQKGVR